MKYLTSFKQLLNEVFEVEYGEGFSPIDDQKVDNYLKSIDYINDNTISKTIEKQEKKSQKIEIVADHSVEMDQKEVDLFQIAKREIDLLTDVSNMKIYMVGGCVRDMMLRKANIYKKEVDDIDMIVDSVNNLKKIRDFYEDSKEWSLIDDLDKFLHIKIVHKKTKEELEFGTFRKEEYSEDSRKPEVQAASVEDEIKRRDFTINTLMAELVSIKGRIITIKLNDETTRFLNDLNNLIIRTHDDPYKVLKEDPIRILRYLRFSTMFEMKPSKELLKAVQKITNKDMQIVSGERIKQEMEKVLKSGGNLFSSGIMYKIFPDLEFLEEHDELKNNINKLLKASLSYKNKPILRWISLFLLVGKAKNENNFSEESEKILTQYGILKSLKLSKDEEKTILYTIRHFQDFKDMYSGGIIRDNLKKVFKFKNFIEELILMNQLYNLVYGIDRKEFYNTIKRTMNFVKVYKNIPPEEKEKMKGREFQDLMLDFVFDEAKLDLQSIKYNGGFFN